MDLESVGMQFHSG